MKLKLLTAAATVALMAVPTAALAGDHDGGWYLRGNVGVGAHSDIDHTGIITGETQSKANIAGSLGLGYDMGDWRLELDGTHLWTDMGQVGNAIATGSKLRTTSLMVNALYDFDEFGAFAPYVGAGLGKIRATSSAYANGYNNPTTGVYNLNPICSTGVACRVTDKDNAWGWQLIAGMGYDISDRLTWDTQYRFQKSFEDLGFNGTTTSGTANNLTTASGEMFMEDVSAHMLMTGFRYNFGAKTPMVTCWDGSEAKMIGNCPVQPVIVTCWDGSSFEKGTGTCPAKPVMITCWDGTSVEKGVATCPIQPTVTCWDNSVVTDAAFCPAQPAPVALCPNQYRQEIIYYEFDKGKSAQTRDTIARILDVGEYCNVEGVRVVGHTDTSGSNSYNLALSKRRAKDAMDELVRQGVNTAVISSEGKGETEPFVPTGDGVKEQLNRRTEVLLTLSETGVIN